MKKNEHFLKKLVFFWLVDMILVWWTGSKTWWRIQIVLPSNIIVTPQYLVPAKKKGHVTDSSRQTFSSVMGPLILAPSKFFFFFFKIKVRFTGYNLCKVKFIFFRFIVPGILTNSCITTVTTTVKIQNTSITLNVPSYLFAVNPLSHPRPLINIQFCYRTVISSPNTQMLFFFF